MSYTKQDMLSFAAWIHENGNGDIKEDFVKWQKSRKIPKAKQRKRVPNKSNQIPKR